MTPAEIEKLTVAKLKDELKKLGLKTGGLKAELVQRLIEACSTEVIALAGLQHEHPNLSKHLMRSCCVALSRQNIC